ncbi:carbon-nitrogen hydrolase family protein [Candidatus Woesearchaeota archaeon]|nr:carbon-nitrogen hydrolase family protein [Candidatus Woesearchaeota archaeon]
MQMEVSGVKSENLKRMLELIEKACGSDVVCFPELCLQCDVENVVPVKSDLAALSEAAVENDVNLIFGSYIRFNGLIKNRIFVMDRKGDIIHRYNKRHPFMSEEDKISKGRVNSVFVLDGVPCAVINCWDYAFPEYVRGLAKKGAKVVFCPAYLMSFPRTAQVLDRIPQVRAFDCMSYFVMVDAFAEDSYGSSRICHPLREIASLRGREGIFFADLDTDEIEGLRRDFRNL